MKIGFGLDLSGYAGGTTCLAALETRSDVAIVSLLTGSVFSPYCRDEACISRFDRDETLEEIVRREVDELRLCLRLGHLAVDVPLDLQELECKERHRHIWELTLRPIDRVVGGLPPLASFLGAPVARFQGIVATGDFKAGSSNSGGNLIFKTYPRASLIFSPSADTHKQIKFYKSKKSKDVDRKKQAISNISKQLKICWDLNGAAPTTIN